MEIRKIKIIFFGTPEFSLPAFRFLIEQGYQILAAVTAPDKLIGRKKLLTSPPVKTFAQQNNIPVFQPASLKKDVEFFQKFKELKPDLCVIVAYGKIIPKDYLDMPEYGFVNIHPSLLPKYRGPSPVQSAILNGEKETGVTIMIADEEVDHGPAISQLNIQISKLKTFEEISQELAELGAKLLIKTLPDYLDGKIKPQPQDHGQATFTTMFSRDDGKINWNQPAEKIFYRIRALNPEPGTWTIWNGRTLNIVSAEILTADSQTGTNTNNMEASHDSPQSRSGQVQIINSQIAVKTSTQYLSIKFLQLEGGKKINVKDFLNGHPDFAEAQLQ